VPATELGRHADGCLQCTLIRDELTARRRVLINQGGIVAYVPDRADILRGPRRDARPPAGAARPTACGAPGAARGDAACHARLRPPLRGDDALHDVDAPVAGGGVRPGAPACRVLSDPPRTAGSLKYLAGSESEPGLHSTTPSPRNRRTGSVACSSSGFVAISPRPTVGGSPRCSRRGLAACGPEPLCPRQRRRLGGAGGGLEVPSGLAERLPLQLGTTSVPESRPAMGSARGRLTGFWTLAAALYLPPATTLRHSSSSLCSRRRRPA